MNTIELDDDAMLRHALAIKETAKREAAALAAPMFKIGICLLLIFAAACAEVFTATVGFRAAFPTLSDGSSLADAIMPMRYAIAAYMLLGHVVLRGIAERFGTSIKWLFDGIGLLAIIVMLVGMARFQYSGTYGVTGSPDDQGTVSAMAGPALGLLCGSLFVTSFLAAHAAAGKLLTELPVVVAGWRARNVIADYEAAIDGVHDAQTRVATRETIIGELSQPNALAERAAVETAHEVGLVTARAHELLSQRQLHGDVDLADDDDAPMRDVPLAALERRYADLAKYDFAHFFNLLKKDTSHA